MSNAVLIINGIDKEGARITLAKLEGFDVSVFVDERGVSFPYRIGDQFAIKVYDPQEREDCDGDTRAWRTHFTMTKTQILDGAIYAYGISYGNEFTALDIMTCDDEHLPWEHDGVCNYQRPRVYQGPVEAQFYQWGEEKPLSYEFHETLGGMTDTTKKVGNAS